MQKYLLLINLGPVQGFIATARRTRDLYAGSRLLSGAAHAVAEVLEQNDVHLIFPSTQGTTLGELAKAGIPNVIMGTVEGKDPAQLAKEAQNAAQAYLQNTSKAVFKRAAGLLLNPEAAQKQVADLLEFYWIAVPYEGEKDYVQARQTATRLMAARKNTRDFAPVSWAGLVQKSSLDGALESVIDLRWKYGKLSNIPDEIRETHEKVKLKLGIRPGEELSGVDLLKRLYPAENFASTSHLAALPFLMGLTSDELKLLNKTLDEITNLVETEDVEQWNIAPIFKCIGKRDPRLLFPSRLKELISDEEKRRQAEGKLAELYQKLKKEPYPYYAILHADGDRMGKAISNQTTVEGHRKLSTKLTEFSMKVKNIVQKHAGSLVYSGGDDVLALLPLHKALDCARELADRFKKDLEDFKDKEGKSPTLSVGLAVVHHLFDLGEALDLARKAEKVAKEKRNSLAVIVAPRSGVELLVRGSWSEEQLEKPLDERLMEYAQWLYKDCIPTGWAYELHELAELMNVETLQEALPNEAVRTLERKGKVAEGVKKELKARLKHGADRAKALARELIAARHFARAFALARKLESKREQEANPCDEPRG